MRGGTVATIYVRAVSDELDKWLDARARELGISKAGYVRYLLHTAREQEGKGKRNANRGAQHAGG